MKKRKLFGPSELSPAELAWLSGDDSQIKPDSWDEYFLWCLNHGFDSMHHGRAISPAELLEQYGHLASPSRRKALQAQITERETKGRPVIKGGKLVYQKFDPTPKPSNIPNNVKAIK